MSTHATITAQLADGTFASIYLHSDGFPQAAGRMLARHYTTQAKVEALIALGGISLLDRDTTAPAGHSFRTAVPGHTVAYHRDRGDCWEINAPTRARTAAQSAHGSEFGMQEYQYLWQDGAWTARDAEGNTLELA